MKYEFNEFNPLTAKVPDISGAAGILRMPAAGYIRRYMPRPYWYLATGIFCLWYYVIKISLVLTRKPLA